MSRTAEIIVVDDEPDLRALLLDYLGLQGFSVRAAENAAALDALLAERPADLLVLDINMPGESGLDALARLRRGGFSGGVIMLTALEGLPERVAALGVGADDFVAKPFALREILARIRAVLRRLPQDPAAAQGSEPIPLGRCRFDPARRVLIEADGTETELTSMEFDLLDVFLRHPGQSLSRERLAELAHGRPLAPGDRSIDIRIMRLRQKIEPDPAAPVILRTKRGVGYVFSPGG